MTTNFTHDAAGSITADGTATWAYNAHRQLASVTKAGQTTGYVTDGVDRRMYKYGATVLRHLYDDANHLIAEFNVSGAVISEYVYLGDITIACSSPAPRPRSSTSSPTISTPRV